MAGRRDRLSGTVTAYDEHLGFGTVTVDGGGEHWFHCTQIADGSRTVPVGAKVRFGLAPGHHGRWEAIRVEQA